MALPTGNFDLTIGGNGFFYAIDNNNPHVRQTNDYKRQQIDTSPEAGEQSLSQWWVRSQDSWHRGAGILNYEPGTNHETEYRFSAKNSFAINPWSQGQLTLSKATTQVDAAGGAPGNCYVSTALVNGDPTLFYIAGTSLRKQSYTTNTNVAITGATIVSGTGHDPVIAGTTLLIGGTGVIYSGATSGTSVTTLWTLSGGASLIIPHWAKGRIIATSGSSIWELTLAGGTIPATPTFTSPIPGGTFAAICEAPDCILAAYNAGGKGYVYRLSLIEGTTAGASPTLGPFVQVAEMPDGEEIKAMKVHLGSFVALGTSLGVRIGDLGANGQISYGPLTIETTSPVQALTCHGRFVYAGITATADVAGLSCVARIDLSQEILNYTNTGYASKTLRYAWAYDTTGTGSGGAAIISIAHNLADDGTTTGTAASGTGGIIRRQSATAYETLGALYSGRIRFGTTEPKTFAYVRLRATIPSTCTIQVGIVKPDGTSTNIVILNSASDLTKDIALTSVSGASYPWVQVYLNLSGNGTETPIIEMLSVKATPLPHVQRLIKYPLRLADFEQDRNGLEVGYDGSAWTRLQALETLEDSSALVTVVDNTNGETFTGIIQQVQFIRDTPPSRNLKNYGGRVNVTVLKI